MQLATSTTAWYAGERRPSGPVVHVVRQGTSQPLSLPGPPGWGCDDSAARRLAWAVLLDASGHASAASDWCGPFAEDVIAHLPHERFVLPQPVVLAWLDQ